MTKLHQKCEIIGSCWVEFNISGSLEKFEHWQSSSAYASIDSMNKIEEVLVQCFENFDLFGPPIFVEPQNTKALIEALDDFAKSAPRSTKTFVGDLTDFLSKSLTNGKTLWILTI